MAARRTKLAHGVLSGAYSLPATGADSDATPGTDASQPVRGNTLQNVLESYRTIVWKTLLSTGSMFQLSHVSAVDCRVKPSLVSNIVRRHLRASSINVLNVPYGPASTSPVQGWMSMANLLRDGQIQTLRRL